MVKTLSILGLFLFIHAGIRAGDISLVLKSDVGEDTISIHASQLDSVLLSRLEPYQSSGHWDAYFELKNSESSPGSLIAILHPGEVVFISNIHFNGLSAKDGRYLKQEFTMGLNTIAADKLGHGEARIGGLGYRVSSYSRISMDENDLYHLNYRVKNRPELKAAALVSFNQSSTADTVAWFGHVNIYVPNFDGRGKSFSLQWKRLRTNSESFVLGYEHPWIIALPLKGVFKFGREVVDGNYQIVETFFGLDWSLDWEHSLIFQYEDIHSIITLEGLASNPQWKADRKQLIGLGYRQVNLNLAAHTGISLRTSLSQEINFEPRSIRRFDFRSESELSFNKRFYGSQRTQIVIQNESFDASDPSTLVALGGVNSVRGYEENVLRSQNIMSFQHDLHMLLSGEAHFLVLMDLGLYTESNSIRSLKGYGIGIQLRSGGGPLRLILASHRGVNVRNSYLHLEYSGGIPWIDR